MNSFFLDPLFLSAMVCLALFGRRVSSSPVYFSQENGVATYSRTRPLTQEERRLSRKERMDYIEKNLVVKHVIRDSSGSEDVDDVGEEGTHNVSFSHSGSIEVAVDEEQGGAGQHIGECDDSQITEHMPSPQSPSAKTHKVVQRLKSNLVLADGDDPDATRDSSREPWICAICLTPYEVGDEICWSPNPECNHVFHHNCIEHWLLKHDECPMCRASYISKGGDDSSSSGMHGDDAASRRNTLITESMHQGIVVEREDDQVLMAQAYGFSESPIVDIENPSAPSREDTQEAFHYDASRWLIDGDVRIPL